MTDPAKLSLLDLDPEEIRTHLVSLGEKSFRADQIAAWIFRRGAESWAAMTDISKKTRERLEQIMALEPVLTALETVTGPDGTRKTVWELPDGNRIESVLMVQGDRLTLCLSSQAGCALGCRFCRTGDLGWKRNLTSGEILGQFLGARKLLQPGEKLTNVVYMGMGEPLLNAGAVIRSLRLLTSPKYLAVSGRHISLSTAGIVPEIGPLAGQNLDFGLTVSLGAPTDELRDQIMPINRTYPLKDLKKALLAYPLKRGRRLTIAYVLMKKVNDSPAEARELSRFLTGLKTKINLIPFNPWPGAPFERPDPEAAAAFQKVLLDKHHTAIIRWSRGLDIAGACGQLAGQTAAQAGQAQAQAGEAQAQARQAQAQAGEAQAQAGEAQAGQA